MRSRCAGRAGCPATGLATEMISRAVRSPTSVSRRGSVKSGKPRQFIEQVDHDHGAVDRCLGAARTQRRNICGNLLSANAGLKQSIGNEITSAPVCDGVRITLSTRRALGRRRPRRWRYGAGFRLVFFRLAFLSVARRSLLAVARLSAILNTACSPRGACSPAIFKVSQVHDRIGTWFKRPFARAKQ